MNKCTHLHNGPHSGGNDMGKVDDLLHTMLMTADVAAGAQSDTRTRSSAEVIDGRYNGFTGTSFFFVRPTNWMRYSDTELLNAMLNRTLYMDIIQQAI